MVTFGLSLLTCVTLGTGIWPTSWSSWEGRRPAALTLNEVRTRTKLIKVGATAALGYFAHDLGNRASGMDQPVEPDPQRQLLARRLGPDGRLLPRRQPAVPRRVASGSSPASACWSWATSPIPCSRNWSAARPGTHNHSITVGAIAEAAAERIGANALLVRIGAYFHDIGKMLKPHYFIENQVGAANRHANLAPAMSTLIIIGHVKDGVDLGRQHHLPEPIIDLIEQHHGTTLVEYFYHEANRRNGANPDAVGGSGERLPLPRPEAADPARPAS